MPPKAKETKVPWIIQEPFPYYHGLAWYWRDFVVPENPHQHGRYLLRFWAVDYMADVWLNDTHIGRHENGETPFVFDVTDAVKPNMQNRLAVRVLNPTRESIDGIVLAETAHSSKTYPFSAGAMPNHGGIEDDVELLIVPSVYVTDMYVWPDPKTGIIHIQTEVRDIIPESVNVDAEFTVTPATAGETIAVVRLNRELSAGHSQIETKIQIENPRLWELNDPYLYHVTVRLQVKESESFDAHSVRCGFREFFFKDGHFRLNDKRIFLRSTLTGNHFPISLWVPPDPEMLRSKLLYLKVMGFNMVRYIAGMPRRAVVEMCDEIGLMLYIESFAGWQMKESPKFKERFDYAISEMIRRDRNHPSVVIWGLLNETEDGPVFRHAVETLPLIRYLDKTRVVLLSSGRWDHQLGIGSISNPGSLKWDTYLGDEQPGNGKAERNKTMGDIHNYVPVPHGRKEIERLRTMGKSAKNPVFLSEYGIGSAVNLMRILCLFEQYNASHVEDSRFYQEIRDKFMVDWERWKLAEAFGRPEEFFLQSLKQMADQRALGLNALRANPYLVGYSLSGATDMPNEGSGLMTIFHEMKPGTLDAIRDGFAPLRWCLFPEPYHIYNGKAIHLEAVLTNEDVLSPGDYPVHLWVLGPKNQREVCKQS